MSHLTTNQIELLLSGALPLEQETELLAHIAECDACAALLFDATAELPLIAPPAASPEQIRRELQQEDAKRAVKQDSLLQYSLRVAVSICAALVLLFSGAFSGLTDWDASESLARGSELSQTISEGMHSIHENIFVWRDFENE